MMLHASGRVADEPHWRKTIRAEPGDVVEYRLRLFNNADDQLRDVSVAVDLPRQMELVFGSERIEDLTVHVATARPLDAALTTRKGVDLTPFGRREVRQIFVEARVKKTAEGRLPAQIDVETEEGSQSAQVAVRAI